MADWVDKSSNLEQFMRDSAINKHVNREQVESSGFCADCCEPIAAKRLEINPYAERCIDCQQNHELRLKQNGGRCD